MTNEDIRKIDKDQEIKPAELTHNCWSGLLTEYKGP